MGLWSSDVKDLELFKGLIKNVDDQGQLLVLSESKKRKYWWLSIFIAGLYHGLNGRVGFFIVTFLFGALTLGILPLYALVTGYSNQRDFNTQIDIEVQKRIKEIKES
jgi:hypothetical protein